VTTEELDEMFEDLGAFFAKFEVSPKYTGYFETVHERIKHFGVYDPSYEVKVNRLRGLIENSYKYMTLNTFKQKVPRETLLDFKQTMSDVTAIVRQNKVERDEDNN
jgi:hypothetical protein